MRVIQKSQFELGSVAIENIQIDPRSRDDIPAILKGLQLMYTQESTREKLFKLLEESLESRADKTVGRPGMDLWRIFVLATLKQGLNCDYDRLQELANQHRTLREIPMILFNWQQFLNIINRVGNLLPTWPDSKKNAWAMNCPPYKENVPN